MTSENSNSELDSGQMKAQADRLLNVGITLIEQKKSIDKAIKCIQKAITLNDSQYKYWQYLGEAYFQRGSLNPAINCFIKSLKLAENDDLNDENEIKIREDDNIHSRLRMSDIRLLVGHLDEAAAGYSEIISRDPNNVDALIGLSKTELQISRDDFSFGLVKSGHSHCIKSLSLILRAIMIRPTLCHAWKLASDCCLTQFTQGQRGSFESKITEGFPGTDAESLWINRGSCVELAQKFLCKSLELENNPDSVVPLWHNIGLCLYFRAMMNLESNERRIMLRRSIKCLLKALKYDRNNSLIRNSLGVVAYRLNLFNSSQSFIIKSIQTSFDSAEIQFSNLGYIYLQSNELTKASAAFVRCQAEDPLYSRSWLGSAIVNENLGMDNLSLLRHCHRLGNNYESQLKFASRIVSLSPDSSFKKDLIDALDCMTRIINYDDRLIEAINVLGLLYERSNHQEQAQLCFDRAYSINPQDPRLIFNKLRQHNASKQGCPSGNLIPELDTEFIKVAEKLSNSASRDYMLNFIYYLFKNNDFKAVDSKITRLLDRFQNTLNIVAKTNAQILLGLAANKVGGDFKSWFFKNIIDLENMVAIETVINLTCLMLVGCSSGDQQLVDRISGDLAKHILLFTSHQAKQFDDLYKSQQGFWLRMAMFSSIFCLEDRTYLIKPFLVLFPTVPEMWLFMGIAMMLQRSKKQTAIYCINKASLLGSNHPDVCFICDILLSILCDRTKHLRYAIYKYPSYNLVWSTLLEPKPEQETMLFQLAVEHISDKLIP